MSTETKPEGTGLQSMVPVLIIAAVAGMLGLAGMIDGWKGDRRLAPAAEVAAPAATSGSTSASADSAPAADQASAALIGSTSDVDRARIEAIVKDYLLNNPEILIEMQQVYESRAEAKRAQQMTEALSTNSSDLFRSASAPVAGNLNGDVTVVEFFDYNCGYCRRAIGDIAKLIETDKNVRFVFKEFPIFGKDSEAAARIAIAAKAQGKYWEVHRGLFEHEGKLNEASALEVAARAGLDIEKLKTDMSSPAVEKEIADVRALAEKMGIQGTPHFFVGDKIIPGAPEDLFDQLTAHVGEIRKTGCSIC
jgi:protein-disulfide isomerase